MSVGANDPKIQIIGYDGNSITLKPVDDISFGTVFSVLVTGAAAAYAFKKKRENIYELKQ